MNPRLGNRWATGLKERILACLLYPKTRPTGKITHVYRKALCEKQSKQNCLPM